MEFPKVFATRHDKYSNEPRRSSSNDSYKNSLNRKNSRYRNHYNHQLDDLNVPAIRNHSSSAQFNGQGDAISNNEENGGQTSSWMDIATDRRLMNGWHGMFGQIKTKLTVSSNTSDPTQTDQNDRYNGVLDKTPTYQSGDGKRGRWLKIVLLLSVVLVLLIAVTVLTVVFVNVSSEEDSYRRYDLSLKVTNRNLTAALANTQSLEFQIFSEEFCRSVDDLFDATSLKESYRGCRVDFLSSGSIVVHNSLFVVWKSGKFPTEVQIEEVLLPPSTPPTTALHRTFDIDPTSIEVLDIINDITVDEIQVKKRFKEKCSKQKRDPCILAYAVCINGICDCIPGRYFEPSKDACLPIDCGTFPSIENGMIETQTGSKFSDTVTIKCDNGFQIKDGDKYVTCKTMNTWKEIPRCSPVECKSISKPLNGNIDTNKFKGWTFGENATITCDIGYRIEGSQVVFCQANGSWSEIPTCQPITCPSFDIPDNGHIDKSAIKGMSFGKSITISCDIGYFIEGPKIIICQSNQSWSEIPTCQPILCPLFDIPENGHIDNNAVNGMSFGEHTTIACDVGHTIEGPEIVFCQANKSWSEIPTCQPVICPSFDIPENGHIDNNAVNGMSFGEHTTIACDVGHTIEGPEIVFCQANKSWSEIPTCQPVICPSFDIPENGHIDNNAVNGMSFGEHTTIACDVGHTIEGPEIVFCQANKSWSEIPTCQPVICPSFDIPENGHIDNNAVNGMSFGEHTTIACDVGHTIEGPEIVFCQANKSWSEIPTCQPVICPEIDIPENGLIDNNAVNGMSFGENTTIACNEGYTIEGPEIVVCQANKSWSGIPTCQPVICPEIDIPENGLIDNNAVNGMSFGENTTIACDVGHTIEGPEIVFCQANKSWSEIPTCQPVICPEIDIPVNGHIDKNAVNGIAFGENTTIACDVGYTIEGPDIVFCLGGMSWSEIPNCNLVDCGSFVPPNDSFIDNAPVATTYMSKITVVCDYGFRLVNDSESTVVCDVDGLWKGEPICQSAGYGNWATWASWDNCGATCGGSVQIRSRTCTKSSMSDMDCVGNSSMERECNSHECPDSWLEWGSWTSCDVTCGEGTHARYRLCNKTSSPNVLCDGHFEQHQTCQLSICPEYGIWTTWAPWGNCDMTCGQGTQIRTRTCMKTDSSFIDCVGSSQMVQTCETRECADCSKQCTNGTLNAACDACECETTTVILKVKTTKGIPINGASVCMQGVPTRIVATTNASGLAELESTCLGSTLIVKTVVYQKTIVVVNSSSIECVLKLTEFPHFTQEPKNQARLIGESVTFCCNALGNPSIKYYEWFVGNIQLPSSSYPNGTHISLDNLQVSNSGFYKCRANSDAGAAYSSQAKLTVKANSNEFCETALVSSIITLPSDCVQEATNSTTLDVGACNRISCRQHNPTIPTAETMCGSSNSSICQASKHDTIIVKCNDYELQYLVTTACDCFDYVEPSVTVSGVASGINTGTPLRFGSVLIDGVLQGSTDANGYFSVSIPIQKEYITLTLSDTSNDIFLDMTKRISIKGSSKSIFKHIKMIPITKPIVVNSSNENKIYASKNASDSNSVAEITVPVDSYYYTNGTPYKGEVQTSLTFIDPTDITDIENSPGQFQYVDEEGTTTSLQTLGVFSMKLKDNDDNELYLSQPMTISFNDEVAGVDTSVYDVWGMNPETGVWEIANNNTVRAYRKKRSFVYTVFDIRDYAWINIDTPYPFYSYCYFKPTIYKTSQLNDEEIVNDLHMSYYIKRGGGIWYYEDDLHIPDKPCFKIICKNENVILDISTSKSALKDTTVLPSPQPGYKISENGRTINITVSAGDDNGPFYSSEEKCKVSNDKSLKYYLPNDNSEVYVFKKVTGETKYFPDNYESVDHKAWYADFGSDSLPASRICQIKVALLNPLPGRKTTIRVMSRLEDSSGDVLGIHEVEHNQMNNETCIEYRCSHFHSTTFITVSLIYKTEQNENIKNEIYKTCLITQESTLLIDANPSNIDKKVFKAFMPVNSGPMYYITVLQYNGSEDNKLKAVENHKPYLRDACTSGGITAVTFTCVEFN